MLSFVGETRLLAINADDELDEASLPGLDAQQMTLLAANTAHDQLLQVTASGARLLDAGTGALLASWTPPAGGGGVSVAASSPTQVLLSVGGGALVLLEATEAGTLEQRGAATLDAEVSCVDVTPLGE